MPGVLHFTLGQVMATGLKTYPRGPPRMHVFRSVAHVDLRITNVDHGRHACTLAWARRIMRIRDLGVALMKIKERYSRLCLRACASSCNKWLCSVLEAASWRTMACAYVCVTNTHALRLCVCERIAHVYKSSTTCHA